MKKTINSSGKRIKVKKIGLIGLIAGGLIFIFFSCNKDTFLDKVISGRTDDPIIAMSYTIETVRYYRNYEAQNKFDTIALTPDVDARNVSYDIFNDGSFRLEATLASRSVNLILPQKPLPDPSKKISRFILENGIFTGYDSLNNLIAQDTIAVENFEWFVDSIKSQTNGPLSAQITNSLLCSEVGVTNLTMANFFEWAEAVGGTVTNFGNGHYTIRITAEQAGDPHDNTTSVILVNRIIDRVLGSVLYDENDNFISSVMFRYSNDTNHFLEGMQIVTMDSLPSGSIAELVNESAISDLSVTYNIQ